MARSITQRRSAWRRTPFVRAPGDARHAAALIVRCPRRVALYPSLARECPRLGDQPFPAVVQLLGYGFGGPTLLKVRPGFRVGGNGSSPRSMVYRLGLDTLLADRGVEVRTEHLSITLLEKAIAAANPTDTQGDSTRLEGLREAQKIRSKVAAHAGGSVAETLKGDALRDYGTFAGHFQAVCDRIANELATVDNALKLLSQE